MDKTALALLQRGDVEGLLALHRATFGATTMTTPDGGAGDTVVVPAPAPTPTPTAVPANLLADPAVQAAIEAARQQEKDKLYSRIEQEAEARKNLEQQMSAFQADLTARQEAEAAALKAAEDAAEEKRLAELSYAERLAETEARLTQRQQELEQQLEQRDLILQKEREFTELVQYRGQLLQQHGDQILPELHDLVAGNTREELDAAVSAMVQRSASILEQVAAATQGARQQARGVGVTAPPVGPSDNDSGYQTYSADDLRNMDMQTYAQNRGRLLGAAAQQQRDRGMFG